MPIDCPLAIAEAAYIAGFLDGEGYITIRRSNRNKARSPSYRLMIGFTNTHLPVLVWIRGIVGAGCINPKSRQSTAHTPAFELTIHQRNVQLWLLAAIQPFIRIKRQQVELGIEFLGLGKIRKTMTARGKHWPIFRASLEDLNIREDFKQKLGVLNKRGISCLQ